MAFRVLIDQKYAGLLFHILSQRCIPGVQTPPCTSNLLRCWFWTKLRGVVWKHWILNTWLFLGTELPHSVPQLQHAFSFLRFINLKMPLKALPWKMMTLRHLLTIKHPCGLGVMSFTDFRKEIVIWTLSPLHHLCKSSETIRMQGH